MKPTLDGGGQYLTFLLGDQTFATEITAVREIVQSTDWTPVPLMPGFVRGIINLRGAVMPVIDLQVRFGRDRRQTGKKTCVVIIDTLQAGERVELGLLVDAVSEVIDIGAADVHPPPSFGNTIPREFIQGMGKVDGDFIVIIDPGTAFNIESMAALVERSAEVVTA